MPLLPNQCPVCYGDLSDLEEGEQVIVMPGCHHEFHSLCLGNVAGDLGLSIGALPCPMCDSDAKAVCDKTTKKRLLKKTPSATSAPDVRNATANVTYASDPDAATATVPVVEEGDTAASAVEESVESSNTAVLAVEDTVMEVADGDEEVADGDETLVAEVTPLGSPGTFSEFEAAAPAKAREEAETQAAADAAAAAAAATAAAAAAEKAAAEKAAAEQAAAEQAAAEQAAAAATAAAAAAAAAEKEKELAAKMDALRAMMLELESQKAAAAAASLAAQEAAAAATAAPSTAATPVAKDQEDDKKEAQGEEKNEEEAKEAQCEEEEKKEAHDEEKKAEEKNEEGKEEESLVAVAPASATDVVPASASDAHASAPDAVSALAPIIPMVECQMCCTLAAAATSKLLSKIDNRWECAACVRVDQAVTRKCTSLQWLRDMGLGPVTAAFYQKARSMRPDQIKLLSLTHAEITTEVSEYHEEKGKFLPLSVWEKKGWDVEDVKRVATGENYYEDANFGKLYRVPVVTKGSTKTTTATNKLELLQKCRKRVLKRSLTDESADSSKRLALADKEPSVAASSKDGAPPAADEPAAAPPAADEGKTEKQKKKKKAKSSISSSSNSNNSSSRTARVANFQSPFL